MKVKWTAGKTWDVKAFTVSEVVSYWLHWCRGKFRRYCSLSLCTATRITFCLWINGRCKKKKIISSLASKANVVYFKFSKENWNFRACKILRPAVIPMCILLANTKPYTQMERLIKSIWDSGSLQICPVFCSADIIVLSINLVRLVRQVSDNHSLNIQGARTIIRWERMTCKSDRADTNGSNTAATHGPCGFSRTGCLSLSNWTFGYNAN